MSAYYNEIDPYAAQWLRNLIAAGEIAPGDVDERSIQDVRADDLRGYAQAHFFAGIGGWSLALRLAGWPDDVPVWTGSCPCQPLSVAGQRQGHADERHLWPAFHRLIAERRPATVFGEQVASKDGREWFAAVRADLEADGYACGAADLCAAGVGAPHIRQRLFWVADGAHSDGWPRECRAEAATRSDGERRRRSASGGADGGLADSDGRDASAEGVQRGGEHRLVAQDRSPGGLVGEVNVGWPGAPYRPWDDADWLFCRDGRWRPVEPGTFPLATGLPTRMGRLRGYGNAIVPQAAAEVIGAFMECAP